MTGTGEPWLDGRIAVRPSAIEGHGLVATRPIAAGTVVCRFGGRLVSSAELAGMIAAVESDPAAPYVDSVTIHEDVHLVLPPGTPLHFGNHSCDPNMWPAGPYELATRRAVRADEELTVDYATISGADGFTVSCRCASPSCRGTVSSEDWRLPVLQSRYAGHWVPALQRRIDGGGGLRR